MKDDTPLRKLERLLWALSTVITAESTGDLQKQISGQGVRPQELHEQTRSDLTQETSEIHKRHDNTDEALRKLLDYYEKEPPSKPGDLDLMAKVLSTFKVQRMNQILLEIFIHLDFHLWLPLCPLFG